MALLFLGIVAGTLTTISFVPQVIKIWKSKSAQDLSMGMFLTFSTGVFCWLLYGIFQHDLPIIIANIVTLALCLTIIVLKFKFSKTS